MSRSRHRRRRRRLVAAVLAAVLSVPLVPVPIAAADTPPVALRFDPPVDAAVSDGWRPPATPYGPGNRGWEYTTTEGEVVRAVGDGTVSFAGPVGGSVSVTVRHVGGLRTTYSLLVSTTVEIGAVVARGDPVGTAGERFHLGALLRDEYIDPGLLFDPGALRLGARLVPLAGGADQSATLTPRSAHRRPTGGSHHDPLGFRSITPHRVLPRSPRAPDPGRPTDGKGDGYGRCQHEAVARGRCPLRASDPPLEPEDEAIHPR